MINDYTGGDTNIILIPSFGLCMNIMIGGNQIKKGRHLTYLNYFGFVRENYLTHCGESIHLTTLRTQFVTFFSQAKVSGRAYSDLQ